MRALTSYRSEAEGFRSLATVINGIIDGNLGVLILIPSSLTTTVIDDRIGINSLITFMPTTANASIEHLYVTSVTAGSFVVNHANTVTTDRTFKYSIKG